MVVMISVTQNNLKRSRNFRPSPWILPYIYYTLGCILRSVTFLACQFWDFHVIFVFGLSLQSNLESFAYHVKLLNMCSLLTCGGV